MGEGLDERDDGSGSVGRVSDGDVRAELDLLDPTAKLVFEALPARRAATPDQLAQRAGLSGVEVIRALPVLGMADLIESTEEGFRIASRLRRAKAVDAG